MAADPKQVKKDLGIVSRRFIFFFRIFFLRHVDAGKLTIMCRLLFELGDLSDRELEKFKKEAQELGSSSTLFAFYLDQSKDRARGVTIVSTTRENMISGASHANVALLVVPANKGGFEASIAKGNNKKGYVYLEIQGQIRQHARLCYFFGIEQLIVSVNKMDDPS
ncbi:translation elongation factor EF-1alpha/Tu, partial [Reticulomyxa filosa]